MSTRQKVKTCVIYIRVSTAMQKMEGWSLDAQRASLTAFAESRGWKVVAIYADEGKSARKRLKDRKEIHRLLEDIKKGGIDIILFKELDRWFRNVSDFYRVQDVLDAYGVTWVSERQPTLDMTTKEGRLNVNVLLSVGQNEADSTSDRIKYTNKYLRQQKRWTSGPSTLPRGYTVDENQRVVRDPEWEPYVRAALDRVMRYGSMQKAMTETNEEFGVNVLYNAFVRMVKSPMLGGSYWDVPDFVENPYLTAEEFNALQERVTRNVRPTENKVYVFSGLVYCAVCGKKMHGTHCYNRDKKLFKYYSCREAKIQRTCTNTSNASEKKMEKALLAYVEEAVADRIAKIEAVHQERKTRPARKSNRATIERQLDKLEDLYISSDRMTKEKYEEKRAAILAKLVEDEPEPEVPQTAGLEQIQKLLDSGVLELYKDFTDEERREFWLKIVREIHVKDRKVVNVVFVE